MPEPITMLGMGSGMVGLLIHLARRYFDSAKEVVDIILAAIALLVSLPVLACCVIMIRLSDKGPIFFTQRRAGKDGRVFTMYKLRTMRTDAEKQSGAVWAKKGDPRIIPVCRWMRRSHVDELPQLINVVKGDMSLVGPRPERPEILEELEKVYPDVKQRLAVKPGITGLAQVRNGYDTTVEAFRGKLRADIEYIARRKWSLELSILARTVAKFHDKSAN